MADGKAKDPRRFFTRAEVRRAWERQGRRCNLCLRELPPDLMHGDHIEAHTSGGATTIANLQALCGSCNLRKGSQPQEVAKQYFDVDLLAAGGGEFRRWQAEALPIVLDAILNEPVLVEACPGAGKTHFGLEIAYRLVEAGHISRVLIVVPTLGIVDGWIGSASEGSTESATLPLRSARDWKPHNPIGDGYLGAVVTYQSLFTASDMFLAHATDPGHRTLVIFDEVHHAGSGSGWGIAARGAFARHASGILSLSGTPFRTERDPIVFVPSEGGSARPHYRYSYDDAIADRACRPVQFVEARGEATFRTSDGRVHTVTFDDDGLTDQGQRHRLRAALEAIGPGTVAAKMLDDANQYVLDLRRQGDTDAAGLVVCVDCDHAADVAAYMQEHLLPQRPIVACSRTHDENDPDPANAIKRFRPSHDPWVVAVNMVSEGIDIKRLRVVVYLTNRLTLLAFRQIVGRVVRTDPANVDDHGRVYIPADPRLLDMARRVTDAVHLLPPPMVIETDPAMPRTVAIHGESQSGQLETLGTVGEQGGAFDTHGRHASAELVELARRFIEREHLSATSPETLALAASENEELRTHLLNLRDEDSA